LQLDDLDIYLDITVGNEFDKIIKNAKNGEEDFDETDDIKEVLHSRDGSHFNVPNIEVTEEELEEYFERM
jgi:hypothetical protein